MGGRKILIPIDGSTHASKAVDFYLGNIKLSDDMVILVHCNELPAMTPGMAMDEFVQKAQEASNAAKELVEKYEQIMRDNGLDVKARVEAGSKVGECVCRVVQEDEPSIIVMGSRGNSAVRRTFVGSNTDYVLHHVHVPVVVVPPPAQ